MILARGETSAFRNITKNFRYVEYFCPCGICTNQVINLAHAKLIQGLRDYVGKPLQFTPRGGSFRCNRYNTQCGGKEKSYHLLGMASDVYVKGMSGSDLYKIAKLIGFTGLGVAKTWLHCDTRPKPALWFYDGLTMEDLKSKLQLT